MTIHEENEKILVEFEKTWKPEGFSLRDFIRNQDAFIGSEMQLRLLRTDLRLRLLAGKYPSTNDYESSFPHFATHIDALIEEEVSSVAKHSNPVEDFAGELPQPIRTYEIIQQVGRDRTSVYYDAMQIDLERKVRARALLFPTDETVANARRFALLEHPNAENTLDIICHNSLCLVISQYEQGATVGEVLRTTPEIISNRRCVAWVRCIADALLGFQKLDISHCNVSPESILLRDDDEAILMNPSFGNVVNSEIETVEMPHRQHLPFPYRSITQGVGGQWSHACDDTVALGLILFQLLTKLPLESFYSEMPLPDESMRLKKLVADQLQYAKGIEPELKAICQRATIGMMEDFSNYGLPAFHEELETWIRDNDSKTRSCISMQSHLEPVIQANTNGLANTPSHISKQNVRNSVAKGLRWLGEFHRKSHG